MPRTDRQLDTERPDRSEERQRAREVGRPEPEERERTEDDEA
jgi:hypothetical protein